MGEKDSPTEVTDSSNSSRRTVLKAAGALGLVGGVGSLVDAQDGNQTDGNQTDGNGTDGNQTETTETETTETTDGGAGPQRTVIIGGRVAFWFGLVPNDIEGAPNPTIRLRPNRRYRVVWINMDGARHQFQITNERGNNVIVESEATARRGQTRSVTFTARQRMARYRCRFHPQQMRGNIIRGAFDGTTTGTVGDTVTETTRNGRTVTETTQGTFTEGTFTEGTFTGTTETTDGTFTETTEGTFTEGTFTGTTETTDGTFTETTTR